MTGRSRWTRSLLVNSGLALASLLLAAVALEVGIPLLLIDEEWRAPLPTYELSNVSSRFWSDLDPVFGVWHEPGARYRHRKACFDVEYRANAHGARDRERQLGSGGRPRFVVLGDSFIEGYGMRSEQRLSDLLEERTGVEHLNFGVSGDFGPTQSLLLYQSLASRFEHSGVIVGLLPANDFLDDDPEYGRRAFAGRYRPYLVGPHPDYRLVYHEATLEPAQSSALRTLQAVLREYSYAYNSVRYHAARAWKRRARASAGASAGGGGTGYAGYFDFDETQALRLEFVLRSLAEQVGDERRLVLLLIPAGNDLRRFAAEGRSPLGERLGALCKELGAVCVDLLPEMHARGAGWRTWFLPCDGHWSAEGNRAAADLVLRGLEQTRGD